MKTGKSENTSSALSDKLPEGCKLIAEEESISIQVAHIIETPTGDCSIRNARLLTNVICEDETRVCIQYNDSLFPIDIPSREITILSITEQ